MKKVILSISVLLSSFLGFSQQEYDDAIELKSKIDLSTGEFIADSATLAQVAVILKPYVASATSTNNTAQILGKLDAPASPDHNPFLAEFINVGGGQAAAFTDAVGSSPLRNIAAIGGTDVTMYADAVAQFMIDRAKAELTVAFFERFKNFTEEHDEIKILFPKTVDRLDNLLAVQYRQMLNVLRNAFQEDLDDLPEHVLEVVEGYAVDHDIVQLSLAIRTLQQVKKLDYMSPDEFIGSLPEITSDVTTASPVWYQNLNASFEMTAILSNALRENSGDRNWVSAEAFRKNILSDAITSKIYFALIYQRVKNEQVTFNGTTVISRFNTAEISWYIEELSKLLELTGEVENTIAQIKESKSATQSQVHSYIETTLEIAHYGENIYEHFGNSATGFSKYLGMVETANEIYKYTYEKQYGSAMMESVGLLNEVHALIKPNHVSGLESLLAVVDNPTSDLQMSASNNLEVKPGSALVGDKVVAGRLAKMNESLAGRTLTLDEVCKELKPLLKTEKKQFKDDNKWIGKLLTYGIFMANMVEAKSSEDVTAIIESVALPVGSSTLRKNSNFSINVTSYLGGSFLTEQNWNASVTAPIGIDFGVGFGKWGSLSLNVSLLDVGAIVDYRLSSDSTEIESKITLGNIFSPGFHLVYGFPCSLPIAFGFGSQYGPGLTSIGSDNMSVINAPAWNWRAFIAVDMPLFNFYNAPKRKL